jgi:hypothetical protein
MIRSVQKGRFSRLAFERKGSVEIVDPDLLDEVRTTTPRLAPRKSSNSATASSTSLCALLGLVQDSPVAAGGLGFVQGGVGGEQRVVMGRRARVEEHATDADGGMKPTGTSVV